MILRKSGHNPRNALLALIFITYSASTIIWTVRDETPPPWDPADHLSIAYDHYCRLAHGEFSGLAGDFFSETHYYAPLFHLVTGLAFLLFGASRLAGLSVNLLSLAVLLLSVDWIARRIYLQHPVKSVAEGELGPSEREFSYQANIAGIAAALLAASYHFSAWLLNYAFLDYALMAVTAGAFAMLIRVGNFRVRREAVLFGVVAGLGMLTKQTFPFFFILPGVYVVAKVFRAQDKTARSNLLISAATMTAIAAIWYIPHLRDLIEIFKINLQAAAAEGEAPVFSLRSNIHYLHGLVGAQIQVPFGILFLCGLLHSLRRRRRESVILYLWMLSGIGVFTFLPNKDLRYTVPILPAVAIISLSWAGSLTLGERRRAVPGSGLKEYSERATNRTCALVRWAILATVVTWSPLSFFNAQWPQPRDFSRLDHSQLRWTGLRHNYYKFDRRPLANDWGVSSIVYTVVDSWSEFPDQENTFSTANLSFSKVERPTLGVIVNLPYLNPSSVALYSRLLAERKADPPLVTVEWIVSETMLWRMNDCDYILVRAGFDCTDRDDPVEMEMERFILSHPERFTKVNSFPLPMSNTEAVIYRVRK